MSDDFAEDLVAMQALMLNSARRLTDSPADAEDLVQDVLERALRFRHLFDGRNLKGWVATIMHNRANDMRRRQQVRAGEDLVDVAHIAGGDVEREAIAHMELEQALEVHVLALYLEHGTVAAVGRIISRHESVTARRIRIARDALRKRWDG